MDLQLGLGLIAAAAAIFCGVMTYRSSSRANTIADRKVDQDLYDRAIAWRDQELDRVTQQADRLAAQIDKISNQLSSEQDVSNALRNQVRTLQNQVDTLKSIVDDMKARNQGRMLTPLPIVNP